jgi:hypothetical protein
MMFSGDVDTSVQNEQADTQGVSAGGQENVTISLPSCWTLHCLLFLQRGVRHNLTRVAVLSFRPGFCSACVLFASNTGEAAANIIQASSEFLLYRCSAILKNFGGFVSSSRGIHCIRDTKGAPSSVVNPFSMI